MKKVLLVADDVEMNRMVIRRFLGNEYEIIEASDGERVMSILKSEHVDLLLLDIIMPEKDGLEVLKEMKEIPELDNVGILVATSTKEKTERMALNSGADDVVAKPYDPIVIRKRLENIQGMKELKIQKEMIEKGDVKGVLREEIEKRSQKTVAMAEALHQRAALLELNAENPQLVRELAKELEQEASAMEALIEPQQEG